MQGRYSNNYNVKEHEEAMRSDCGFGKAIWAIIIIWVIIIIWATGCVPINVKNNDGVGIEMKKQPDKVKAWQDRKPIE